MKTCARDIVAIIASLVCTIAILSLRSCHGSEVRRLRKTTRITVTRPVRAQGRAAAGYPVLQTMANTTRIAANVSGFWNPIGWILRW